MTILENYLKSKKVQKVLSSKPGEEGFSLVELVVVIAVLAILSAVAIPAFVGVQANARASAVKNGLVNGVKECVVLAADNQLTPFFQHSHMPLQQLLGVTQSVKIHLQEILATVQLRLQPTPQLIHLFQ